MIGRTDDIVKGLWPKQSQYQTVYWIWWWTCI